MNKETIKADSKTFKAICRVNTCIALNRYASFKKHAQNHLEELKANNGDDIRLPKDFGLHPVRRGEIMTFGEETIVDEETGAIQCLHKEIFETYSKRYVELPCAVVGEVKSTLNTAISLLPPSMRKLIEEKKEVLASRFRVEPIFEKYTGQELEA
jgi:hypothetical protein